MEMGSERGKWPWEEKQQRTTLCSNCVVGNINQMKKFKVLIPDEHYSVLNLRQEDLPGVAVVNNALRDFESKEAFAQHLLITVYLTDLVDNCMPSKTEVDVIDNYGDFLDDKIKGDDKEKPNHSLSCKNNLEWYSGVDLESIRSQNC